jgi:hypothetical protein
MQERELLILIFGLGVLVYFLFLHRELELFTSLRLVLLSLVLLICSWFLDLLDNRSDFTWLQPLEHSLHAAAAVSLLAWIWLRRRKAGP